MKRVGVLFGMENTFPPALVDRINGMNAGIHAEFVRVGATQADLPSGYDLIIDRISHDIPYYRSYLKNAVLHGTIVVNNPFWWSADDKFFNYALAAMIGVSVPRTVLLPSKSHPANTTAQSMRNLEYPLPWKSIFAHVGFPAFLKPHSGGGWKNVYHVFNESEFFAAYDQTGDLVMTLQQAIPFDDYVRCYCIGQKKVRIMRYDPLQPHDHRYVSGNPPLEEQMQKRITKDCLALNRALGYDINTVEFAIRDGIPYAIDFLNPAPDADYYSVGAENFSWVIDAVAEMVIEKLSAAPRKAEMPRWSNFLDLGSSVHPEPKKKAPAHPTKRKAS